MDRLLRESGLSLSLLLCLCLCSCRGSGALASALTPGAPGAPGAPAALSAAEEHLAAGVDSARLVTAVRELCALGARMGGTSSGERAVQHRVARFRAIGLAVRVHEDSETWCHEEHSFTLRAHVTLPGGSPESFELHGSYPYGFSPSAKGRVPLLLGVGVGAHLADRVPNENELAAQAGPLLWLCDGSSTDDGRYAVVHHLRPGRDNPFPVFGISRHSGERLRAWVARGAQVEIEYALESSIERARPRTVVASLPAASGAPRGFFLVCAHGDSDSGGPGANDNGSGEAIVVEMARVYSRLVNEGLLPPPAREIRFAIFGKEIHSTRDLLARENGARENGLLGVLNFDQAGYGSGADQLNIEPDDLPANEDFVRLAAGLLREREQDPRFPTRWATNKSLGGTDSYVFSRSAGFADGALPAVTVFISAWNRSEEHPRTPGMPGESWSSREQVYVDFDRYYHSAGDLPENTTDLEPFGMAWCARVGLISVWRYLESLEPRPPRD